MAQKANRDPPTPSKARAVVERTVHGDRFAADTKLFHKAQMFNTRNFAASGRPIHMGHSKVVVKVQEAERHKASLKSSDVTSSFCQSRNWGVEDVVRSGIGLFLEGVSDKSFLLRLKSAHDLNVTPSSNTKHHQHTITTVTIIESSSYNAYIMSAAL
jgi:hypothetical protein